MINRQNAIDVTSWQMIALNGHKELVKVVDAIYDSVGSCSECKFLDDRKDNKLGCNMLQFKVTPNFYCALFKRK